MRGTPFLCGLLVLLLTAPVLAAASEPTRETHWLSLINKTHRDPGSITVTVVPPGVLGIDPYTGDPTWVGPQAAHEMPPTQAVLEAVDYWAWVIDEYESTWPHLAGLHYDVQIVGRDVRADVIPLSDIVISTAMVMDPVPFLFHAGLGLPTWGTQALLGPRESTGMNVCTVWNTGAGVERDDGSMFRLRNLVIHEFGHCLAVGHTGTSLGLDHCSKDHGCFDQHPTDVMSNVHGADRQCISNLNVQSLADGYHWLATGSTWRPHAGETFMKKSDYAESCMPADLERF